jgi:hypothetical protein
MRARDRDLVERLTAVSIVTSDPQAGNLLIEAGDRIIQLSDALEAAEESLRMTIDEGIAAW